MLDRIQLEHRLIPDSLGQDAITEYSGLSGLVCPYFHQRFITADQRFLICEGRFADRGDVVRIDLVEHTAVRLTDAGARVHVGDLAPDGRRFFFMRGGNIHWVDIFSGDEECFAEAPSAGAYQPMSCLHFSADGTSIVTGGNREHASGVKEGRVWAVDAVSGAAEPIVDRPFQIGHVQCSTVDPDLVMYCHETGGASPQRMWLARRDGVHPGALFDTPGHPWVTHETFTGDGLWIVFVRNPEGIGMTRPDGSELRTFEIPHAWHTGPSRTGDRILFDVHGGDVGILDVATGEARVFARKQHGGSKAHPHPCFAPDDRTAVWTSTAGKCPTVCILNTRGVIGDR
ncbi:MAG: hypothetical protein HN742_03655 [Lentisphaerae bacterium]|nr:hypothetical protein [Lentisphaerota bacterium]MBT4814886.1 hypothetical protein [Lentisphaerota bacterium]MBT5605329.1 hypothetical protein [Lentisphaerota bacterium]MBT7055881.1 hypothetical protein [Lentisphaerota bacterium]MBT7840937.1 hypothetical protein [Lentisphaerota bacterium]